MTQQTQGDNTPLLSVGVDWLTVTALNRKSSSKMQALSEFAMKAAHLEGNDVKPWGMSGFDGMKCGPIQCGTRGDETIVRLTGEYAASNWRRFYALSDSVSRIDLQVTADVGRKASLHVAHHYKQAARARKKLANFPNVWECRSADGPATLYFGKRVSELFARVYDKFSEAGENWPTSAVRYELQCNGKQAKLNAARLFKATSEIPAIRDRVFTYFSSHALTLQWPAARVSNVSYSRRRSDDDRRLLWIRKAVKPSVKSLVDHGRVPELLEALGLTMMKSGKIVTLRVAKAS